MPKRYKPCCGAFDARTLVCKYDVRYEWWPDKPKWAILLCDGGTSGIMMNYCPHCGKKLPGRSRTGREIQV